jgi:hypothetical protein
MASTEMQYPLLFVIFNSIVQPADSGRPDPLLREAPHVT